jgi:hypothetical protein
MRNLLLDVAEASALVKENKVVLFAGAEETLAKLPPGRWIGGTTAYFVDESGGNVSPTKLFCTVVEEAADANAVVLQTSALPRITEGRFPNGFTYVLLPGFSEVHDDTRWMRPATRISTISR